MLFFAFSSSAWTFFLRLLPGTSLKSSHSALTHNCVALFICLWKISRSRTEDEGVLNSSHSSQKARRTEGSSPKHTGQDAWLGLYKRSLGIGLQIGMQVSLLIGIWLVQPACTKGAIHCSFKLQCLCEYSATMHPNTLLREFRILLFTYSTVGISLAVLYADTHSLVKNYRNSEIVWADVLRFGHRFMLRDSSKQMRYESEGCSLATS